MISSFHYECC